MGEGSELQRDEKGRVVTGALNPFGKGASKAGRMRALMRNNDFKAASVEMLEKRLRHLEKEVEALRRRSGM